MARDPFDLPSDLHVSPVDLRLHPLEFELGRIWPRPIDRLSGVEVIDESPLQATGLEGFGLIWLDWLGGPRDAARLVRKAFEGKTGTETWLTPRRPLLRLGGYDPDLMAWTAHPIRATRRQDIIERNFSLVGLLLLTGARRDPDKGACIRMALDVENLARRRDDAMRQGMNLGLLRGRGVSGEKALAALTGKTRWKIGAVRANRDRAIVKAIIAAFAGSGVIRAASLPHLADGWFAEGRERDVALGITYRAIECIKLGRRPEEGLRWALLNLIEGYWKRDLGLANEVIYALAACLELLDEDGRPRRDLSLSGVTHRARFIEHAAECAWPAFGDYFHRTRPADPATEDAWLNHALHPLAKEAVRAQLRRHGVRLGAPDSKIERDHSEADSSSLL